MKKIIFLIATFFLISCGGGGSNGGDTPPTPPSPKTEKKPEEVIPQRPSDSQLCIDSQVRFAWEKARYATEYVLKIFNANGSIFVEYKTTKLEKNISLEKGKSYSWHVIARNNAGESISATKVFVTEGDVVININPYSKVTLLSDSNKVRMKFFDAEKQSLKYTLYYSSDKNFTDADIISEHRNIVVSAGQTIETVIPFNQDFWLKVVTEDSTGSQSSTIVGYRLP